MTTKSLRIFAALKCVGCSRSGAPGGPTAIPTLTIYSVVVTSATSITITGTDFSPTGSAPGVA